MLLLENYQLTKAAFTASTTLSPCSSTQSGLVPALQSLRLGPSPPRSGSLSISLNKSQRRHAWFGRKSAKKPELSSSKELTSTAAIRSRLMDSLANRGLEGNSMFSDELTGIEPATSAAAGAEQGKALGRAERITSATGASLVKDHAARALDPDPRSRVRWERKMVIQNTRSATNPFSRESRLARIVRTERATLTRSPYLPTSVKKLVHLSRQIQGKTLAEALEQMRYSKKKMAAEVAHQLKIAHERAVVMRGMGLGKARKQKGKSAAEGEQEEVKIQTKDGKWLTIDDPTRIYVAQSWVGRGPWRGFEREYRARGVVNILKKPSTSEYIPSSPISSFG
jgi:ribosomal protein L22